MAVESTERREDAAGHGRSTVDVRLDHVTKRFDDVIAVDDLSLEIERGSFFALLGPSGCGKTTTLRMIGGFEEPTDGDDLPRRRAGHREAAVQARRQHGLPVVRALPAPDDLRERRLRPAPARGPRRDVRGPGDRDPAAGRPRGARQAQAAPALGRPAAAGRARARARQQAARAAPRRAARRARPEAPQADAARAEGDPARRRHHLRPRHARPGGGDDDGGRDRDHERRQDRAARRADRALREPADGVRRRLPRHLEPARRAPSRARPACGSTTAPTCASRTVR